MAETMQFKKKYEAKKINIKIVKKDFFLIFDL